MANGLIKTSAQLRSAFLEFFEGHGHKRINSSPLVPGNDPTLLFTNAGMVQFKDVFLGQDKRNYKCATSSQRCVRAGGKHNDLENVGYTARHHTFFEMLGNFSFGDYFKREAIQYAWDFLTKTIGLPEERLWVTVFENDDEATDIWLNEMKISPDRFSKIGAKDNFWSMGDTGPCGPCSEIFYDHGEDVPGGPPGTPEEEGNRYIEIWNLVFMQYNRDKSGKMHELPHPSVDTGMGMERLAAILQGVHNNYEIDLFQHIIKTIAKLADCDDLENKSLRVIADHIRACSFLIVDGIIPSNEGRGYVLRRIIRRAIRHGHKLGLREPFFYKLVDVLQQEMGEAYPELTRAQAQVEKVLKQEEVRFAETLDQGMHILELEIKQLKSQIIPGDVVFKLYDTYGFPVDLTADVAREHGLEIDREGYEQAMEKQREMARASSAFDIDYNDGIELEGKTEFLGYDRLQSVDSQVLSIIIDGELSETLSDKQSAMIILDSTPFYGESGGQVGDTGVISTADAEFVVSSTQKNGDVFVHLGKLLKGSLKITEKVTCQVNPVKRIDIACNHSATHLLHSALRHILGDHVQQKGSLVDNEKLRFDFSHFEAINTEQLQTIETLVNQHIRKNHLVETKLMDIDAAKESGAMALFGEKYADQVRVLSMSEFSVELCGGTHVSRTGDIGLLKITSESGVAAGVRRIEAVTGQGALSYVEHNEQQIDNTAALLKANRESVFEKVSALLERSRKLEKELDQLKGKLANAQGSELTDNAVQIKGINVLAAKLEGVDAKGLRDTMDQLKSKLGSCAIVLAVVNNDKVSLAAGVSKDSTKRIKAGDLVNSVACQVGGKGGGRPDMAMAGGNQPENIEKALSSVPSWIENQLE
ncbi:MAG: alanine--tRNA ligase [gamma proteobacterium symbiont of Bathyaustriella thionipta]|nr:alanine--tRNA ligase [gamma proteobacterium symbiont of Bathyaustriella thionipta]MCU7950285.1 alanine--tRNA ligase [gamma proteobacterium symbiont of Bathyaustriella thionipta]MCU7951816.1 alanine--tRNA ligase [gamma proteobacterium symbiont of Bathyaustriella thionipta]MCU7957863.1 alanine--tRNA ligase [gamma proteobacterium symbiont of Bathyaustriella thionipta]